MNYGSVEGTNKRNILEKQFFIYLNATQLIPIESQIRPSKQRKFDWRRQKMFDSREMSVNQANHALSHNFVPEKWKRKKCFLGLPEAPKDMTI